MAKKAVTIPVKYLDMANYWEMVKKSSSYQVRVEAGVQLSSDEIAFTPYELSLSDDKVLATRDKKTFVTGKEYNEYVNANYDQLRTFVRRGKPLTQAQNFLITKITGEKIVSETMDPALIPGAIEIERHIAGFIRKHAFDNPISMRNCQALSPSEVMDSLNVAFEHNNGSKIEKLRNGLMKGFPQQNDKEVTAYIKNLKSELVKKNIQDRMTVSEVREWMALSNFPGNFNEAKFVLTNKKYEENLQKIMQDNAVELNLIQ